MRKRQNISSMQAGRFLRLARIVVSIGVMGAASLLFATLSVKLIAALGWVEKIQILPLALVSCLGVLGLWLVITLIFGRLYCSTACPLGTLQDVVARLPRMPRRWGMFGRRNPMMNNRPYRYASPRNALRYSVFLLFFLLAAIGASRLPELIDPYNAFVRIIENLLRPIAELVGGKDVIVVSVYSFVMAVFTLGALAIAAWMRGRIFCNTLCPVGTGLSVLSRFSIFHFDIDTDRCTNCRRCEYVCKAQCINLNDHVVDGSRCVVCFDCIDSCPHSAIRYTTRRKQLSIPMLQRIASPPVRLATDNPSAPGCLNSADLASPDSTKPTTNTL